MRKCKNFFKFSHTNSARKGLELNTNSKKDNLSVLKDLNNHLRSALDQHYELSDVNYDKRQQTK